MHVQSSNTPLTVILPRCSRDARAIIQYTRVWVARLCGSWLSSRKKKATLISRIDKSPFIKPSTTLPSPSHLQDRLHRQNELPSKQRPLLLLQKGFGRERSIWRKLSQSHPDLRECWHWDGSKEARLTRPPSTVCLHSTPGPPVPQGAPYLSPTPPTNHTRSAVLRTQKWRTPWREPRPVKGSLFFKPGAGI